MNKEKLFTNKESGVETQTFEKAIKYLGNKFPELENDYSNDDGYVEHCGLIAGEVAKLILADGGHPQLLSIRGQKVDSMNTETLEPKRYAGRVVWGGHTVCENNGVIYDPMIGEPVNKKIYLENTFSKPVVATVLVPQEKMNEFIKRG